MAELMRRRTVTVEVGGVRVGSDHPIVVQSMTNTDTADAEGTAHQVAALAAAGSELVRVTVNTEEAAAAVPRIAERLAQLGYAVPLIGDFHYNGHILLRKHPDSPSTASTPATWGGSGTMRTSGRSSKWRWPTGSRSASA